jgi:serine/threonine-protein kinase RsbW
MLARGIHVVLRSDTHEIRRLADAIEYLADSLQLPQPMIFKLNLALDELITNVIAYGYAEQKDGVIDIEMRRHDDRVVVKLIDSAAAFDPLSVTEPDTAAALEDRKIGGLGIHFVRTLIDEVDYRRDDDRNVITLTLLLPPEPVTANGVHP